MLAPRRYPAIVQPSSAKWGSSVLAELAAFPSFSSFSNPPSTNSTNCLHTNELLVLHNEELAPVRVDLAGVLYISLSLLTYFNHLGIQVSIMPQGLLSERSDLPAPDKAVATEDNTHKPNESTDLKNAKVSTDRSGKEISAETFPPIRHGGSLLLAWQIRKRTVLLVGGGVVAAGRLTKILEADANCILISPKSGLSPEVKFRIFTESDPEITYLDRNFSFDTDFEGVDMVMTAIDDNPLSEAICTESRRRKIPVNIADVPPQCDFYFGSEIRQGPLQIVVSTNGKGPKISNIVRRRIQAALPANVGVAIENVGKLRAKLRKVAPGVGGELGARRMKWMIDVCECYNIPQLAAMDEAKMDQILNGWDDMSVPGGGKKGCPLGYKRSETDAGCPWGFKKEDGVIYDSRVLSALTGMTIGAMAVLGYVRFMSRA